MYAVNQCSNPTNLVSPGDKTFEISVMSSNYVKREEKKIRTRLEKKFQNLLAEKQKKNGIQPNPNKL